MMMSDRTRCGLRSRISVERQLAVGRDAHAVDRRLDQAAQAFGLGRAVLDDQDFEWLR